MATSAHDLDLPEIEMFGLERNEAKEQFEALRGKAWLARMPLGYTVLDYADVQAILRDRRFHSAVSMAQMMGAEAMPIRREQPSILAMEGPEHGRLRRLAAPAF